MSKKLNASEIEYQLNALVGKDFEYNKVIQHITRYELREDKETVLIYTSKHDTVRKTFEDILSFINRVNEYIESHQDLGESEINKGVTLIPSQDRNLKKDLEVVAQMIGNNQTFDKVQEALLAELDNLCSDKPVDEQRLKSKIELADALTRSAMVQIKKVDVLTKFVGK